jgi:hypothetical protein
MKKGIIGYGGFAREVKALLIDNNPNEKIEFFGAETDEDFIALANHIGGDCETVADAISFINGNGWIAMKDAISL